MNSSVLENASAISPLPAVQNNLSKAKASANTLQSTKVHNLKISSETKTKPDNNVQTVAKVQSTLPKVYSIPTNSQQAKSTDTKLQTTKSKTSVNEPTKTIDLSSLSAVLEDGKNKDDKSTIINDATDKKHTSDTNSQNTSTFTFQNNKFININYFIFYFLCNYRNFITT